MKKVLWLVAAVCLVAGSSAAQFKSQVQQESQSSITRYGESQSPLAFMFSWFDPDRFSMRHSFNMTYSTFGGQGLSLGTYTNSMRYAFDDNLNARADISLSYSPYNTLAQFDKNDLSKIYISRAEINYKPWENVSMQVQYRQVPYGGYYYSPFYNPWYRESGF